MKVQPTDSNVGAFQLSVLILSLVALGALAADTLFEIPKEAHNVIQGVDTLVCLVLLTDFSVRLYRADSKLAFMKWGWIDLVSSIPNLDLFRWGRLVRVLRIIQLLRGIRSVHRIVQLVLANRMQGSGASLLLAAFLLVTFSSVSILILEPPESANIKTAEDAVWWSMTTMTTVGYGDTYPVSSAGRCIGVVLMVCGVGLFGAISGLVASVFVGQPRSNSPEDTREILRKLSEIESRLGARPRSTDSEQYEEPRRP